LVQFSPLYNKVGTGSILYSFILVFFGLNTLFIMSVFSCS
jgi:hypothetical protein